MTKLVKRNAVKVILLNENNELLLILVDDPKTTPISGKSVGMFWCFVGGGIEENETIQETAIRELKEETGLGHDEITLGPVVWIGEWELILAEKPTALKETFIVVKAKRKDIAPHNFTDWEKSVFQKMKWFSLEEIKNCTKTIYPSVLLKYLPEILSGRYPKIPIQIHK